MITRASLPFRMLYANGIVKTITPPPDGSSGPSSRVSSAGSSIYSSCGSHASNVQSDKSRVAHDFGRSDSESGEYRPVSVTVGHVQRKHSSV